jgi:hypothetical protein
LSDGVTVAQGPLEAFVLVRIQVGQPGLDFQTFVPRYQTNLILHGVNPSRFGVAAKWQVSSMKFWWNVLRDTVKDFLKDKALRLAAALAYYSIFSLAPLLIIMPSKV